MTFLELCRRVREEGAITTAGPDTVVNQSDMLAKIVNWVREADYEVQTEFDDWLFLWSELQSSISAGLLVLEIPDCKTLNMIEVSGRQLVQIDYHALRRLLTGSAQGAPNRFAVSPDGGIRIYPAPDSECPLYAAYFRRPARLMFDADVSAIPDDMHMIIVYRALMMLAASEEDERLFARAEQQYQMLLQQMSNRHRPKLKVLQ